MLKFGRCCLVLAVLLSVVAIRPATPTAAQSASRTFTETGKTVRGKFLDYWTAHGGLTQVGLPLSDEIPVVSTTDGKTYTAQYFERAVLEMHPENAGSPYEIEGALLGNFYYAARYPSLDGAPGQKASTTNPQKFTETGKTVGGAFRTYWEGHGGLAQFGFPITDEFSEKSQLDGKTYTVQYFERAAMELHPEYAGSPFAVLLGQLGTYQYKAETGLSLTDWTGTPITLAKRPERIVCLVALCEDILFDLGLEPVAVNDKYYQNPEFWGPGKTFPAIAGAFASPNVEDIVKAKPDLVIGFAQHIGLRDALKNVAPLYIMNPATYQDSLTYLRQVGYLTNRSYQANQVSQQFISKLAAYKAKSPNNKVPLIIFGGTTNFSIFTQGSLIGSVIGAVTNYPWPAPPAGQPGSTSPEPGALQYSLEQILEKDPDVLLLESNANAPQPLTQQLAANPIWSQLKAVQTGQVYEVRRDVYVAGRGPRSLGIALDDAMKKIYPTTFPNPLP